MTFEVRAEHRACPCFAGVSLNDDVLAKNQEVVLMGDDELAESEAEISEVVAEETVADEGEWLNKATTNSNDNETDDSMESTSTDEEVHEPEPALASSSEPAPESSQEATPHHALNQAPEASGMAAFVLGNRSWLNATSWFMILYAVWAVVEVLTNTFATGAQGLTLIETGSPTNTDASDLQRNNAGWVIASGAVAGLIGLAVQYIYQGAPIVDASMRTTATLIMEQTMNAQARDDEIIAKAEKAAAAAATAATQAAAADASEAAAVAAEAAAEAASIAAAEAATTAATEVARETAEDAIVEMLDGAEPEEEAPEAEDEPEEEAPEAGDEPEEEAPEAEGEPEEEAPEAEDEPEEEAPEAEDEPEDEAEEEAPEAGDEPEEEAPAEVAEAPAPVRMESRSKPAEKQGEDSKENDTGVEPSDDGASAIEEQAEEDSASKGRKF